MNFASIIKQMTTALKEKGIPMADIARIETQIYQKMESVEAPTIAFVGFTGVGKSSTLNALFNAGQPTSDVRACTKEAKQFRGDLQPYTGNKGIVNVYDMPGLGESIIEDRKYYDIYAEVLPKVDVIIWTFHAGDRAMTPMQNALLTLIDRIGMDFTKKLLFAVNKADTAAPGECSWNERFNIPSPEQKENLKETEAYIRERVREVLPNWNGAIVSYSAKRRFRLEQLMTAMVSVMPDEKKWVLSKLADVADYSELIDPEYLEYIRSMAKN